MRVQTYHLLFKMQMQILRNVSKCERRMWENLFLLTFFWMHPGVPGRPCQAGQRITAKTVKDPSQGLTKKMPS